MMSTLSALPFLSALPSMVISTHHQYPGLIGSLPFNTTFYQDSLFNQLQIIFPSWLTTATIQRRAEYLAGRYLAGQLLTRYGSQVTEVGRRNGRCPAWPTGFFGSISHTANIALCALHDIDNMGWVGVDIESIMPLTKAQLLQTAIAKKQEWRLLNKLPITIAATLLFSAKESLFKAVYPTLKRYFGFHQVELIAFNEEKQQLTFYLSPEIVINYSHRQQYNCFYHYDENNIFTIVYFH